MRKHHGAIWTGLVATQLMVGSCDRYDRNSHSTVNEGAHVGASAPPAYEGSRDPNGQRDRAVGGGPAPAASEYLHPTTTPQPYRHEAPLGDPTGHAAQGSSASSPENTTAPAGDGLGATGFGSRNSESNGGLGASGARPDGGRR